MSVRHQERAFAHMSKNNLWVQHGGGGAFTIGVCDIKKEHSHICQKTNLWVQPSRRPRSSA